MTQLQISAESSSSQEVWYVPGIQITDRHFDVPVDHSQPNGPSLQVFIRQCAAKDTTVARTQAARYLVFFQGGPGFECGAVPNNSGMLAFLLRKGYIVIYLDQRGTGLSSPLTSDTVLLQGDIEAQVTYCKRFRADSIVRDCEVIRKSLNIATWTLLGQSFGGFVILTYLSLYPESLDAVFITGGMAPVAHSHPDMIYSRLAKKIIKRNDEYYENYPQDIDRVRAITRYLDQHSVSTPNGGDLTSRRFLQIGLDLGMHGGFERLHVLLVRTYNDLQQFRQLTYKSRELIEQALHFDGNPIYAILHEAIYCQSSEPSNWSAHRVLSALPQFGSPRTRDEKIYFYGETIFPWMFDDYSQLRPIKKLAERLAQESWSPLYDLEKLKKNTVPFAASCYIEDMYVHIDLAIEALQRVGGTKDLVTNRWLHNGLRHAPEELLGYLFNLLQEDRPRT